MPQTRDEQHTCNSNTMKNGKSELLSHLQWQDSHMRCSFWNIKQTCAAIQTFPMAWTPSPGCQHSKPSCDNILWARQHQCYLNLKEKPLCCPSWTMFWGRTAVWLSIASWNLLSPWKGTSRVWTGSTFLFRSSAKTVWYMAVYGPPATGMWREQVLPSYLSTSYWGCGCGR